MKLFSIINDSIPEGEQVVIVVAKTGCTLTASVDVRNEGIKDDAKNFIQPLVLRGSAQELDEQFENEIVTPMQQTAGLHTSMAEYEAAKQVAQAKSKAATEAAQKAKDAAKKKAEAQKKALAEAKALADAKKWTEAANKYRHILADESLGLSDTQKASIRKNIETCESRDGGLFGEGGDPSDAIETIETVELIEDEDLSTAEENQEENPDSEEENNEETEND